MGVAMGDKATVNGVSTTQQWKLEYAEDDRPYAASNTYMGSDRSCGITDWTGQYWAYGGQPAVFPGDDFTFSGEATLGVGASGTAIAERMVILWEQEKNNYIRHIVPFAGNGNLSLTSATVNDSTVPNMLCGANLLVKLNDVALADVRSVTFDASRRYGKPPGQLGNRPYSSSSVPGKIRRKKGYLDYSVKIDCYVDSYASLPALQSSVIMKLYTSSTLFWELKWARIVALSEIGTNAEEADYLNVIIEAKMQASYGGTLGYIKAPDTTQKWPG